MTSGRTGRRPGRSGTREQILIAARSRFAEVGFDRASVKSIAGNAGVDSALVHHYFGTKRELFIASVSFPLDPGVALAPLAETPLEEMGEAIARTVVSIWDSPAGASALAAFRDVITGGDEALFRTFLLDIALSDVRERVDAAVGDGRLRIALVAAQLVGVFVSRKLLQLEPVASQAADDITVLIAPTLQHYLTGTLGTGTAVDSPRSRTGAAAPGDGQ